MSDAKIALAISQNVTANLAATWNPSLLRSPRVLVPVELRVLMVRQPGGTWAKTAMTVPTTDKGTMIDASTMMPDPFQARETGREAGAYLHWAVPDALTVGSADDQNPKFPAIPNRWLVMRICPSLTKPGRRTIKGWVLQAGGQVPVVTPLESWTESGKPDDGQNPLTILGHGDAAWAAYYDNVENRLAYHDDLRDCPQGPISYVVCGWYSDPNADPLGDPNIHSLADFETAMQKLQWSLPDDSQAPANNVAWDTVLKAEVGLSTQLTVEEQAQATSPFDIQPFIKPAPGTSPAGPPYVTDGSWWPQGTVFHGAVLGIGWPAAGTNTGLTSEEEGGPPSPNDINIAIGNTMGETMAALVAKATGSTQEARMLEAFQQGTLAELNEPDGVARLDSQLHASAFATIAGGTVPDRTWQAASGGPIPAAPANPATPSPGVFTRYQPSMHRREIARVPKVPIRGTTIGEIDSNPFQASAIEGESNILAGGLKETINWVAPPEQDPYSPAQWIDTLRSLPRLFHPKDPVLLIQGGNRDFQYGNDPRFGADGTLQCRLTGTLVHSYCKRAGDIEFPPIYPDDVLDRGVDNGSVPPECDEILGEAAILDPGAAATMIESASNGVQLPNKDLAVRGVRAEQTTIHALRDPRVDVSNIIAQSGFAGRLPAPASIGLPTNPWSPVHLEWLIEFTPSPDPFHDWVMGETDFNETPPKIPDPKSVEPLQFQGRCPVSTGATLAAAMAVRRAVDQIASAAGSADVSSDVVEQAVSAFSLNLLTAITQLEFSVNDVPDPQRAQLDDIANTLENMDVLSAALNTLHLRLRGGYPSDGTSAPKAGDPMPSLFFPLRAGFLRILRLRLVDGFGQFIDLAGSDATHAVDPTKLYISEPLQIPSRPDLIGLPPRFTAPARLWFRYMDALGSGKEACLATDKAPGLSPVCGYLMPNHLDAALEFFGDNGSNLGTLRPADDGTIVWENAPGIPSTVGQSPLRAVQNHFLGSIGDGLIRWGVADAGLPGEQDTALQALLRVIDSTLWAIDPFGHVGDEHLALLVGHPIVVMRARLNLELAEPVDMADAQLIEFPVRLGALTHWQDGLLGYFVNDDYSTLYCSDAVAAGLARDIGPSRGFLQQVNLVPEYFNGFDTDKMAVPVTHPYINTSGVTWVRPGQEVKLTLLVEPLTNVYATSGIVPRKEIGMRREWVTDALAKLAPTFRFGPVLVDTDHIRMPIASELNGTWSWDHRQDVLKWASDSVTNATQDALLSADPPVGSEGWLQLNPPPKGAQP